MKSAANQKVTRIIIPPSSYRLEKYIIECADLYGGQVVRNERNRENIILDFEISEEDKREQFYNLMKASFDEGDITIISDISVLAHQISFIQMFKEYKKICMRILPLLNYVAKNGGSTAKDDTGLSLAAIESVIYDMEKGRLPKEVADAMKEFANFMGVYLIFRDKIQMSYTYCPIPAEAENSPPQ